MSRHYIIGCGGIGGWVVPLLLKMKPPKDEIILMDGDRIEERNFDRQFFQYEHLGWNKAEALAQTYGLGNNFLPRYLSKGTRPKLQERDWIWCCVDNHPARLECLNWADEQPCYLLIGGNEYEYQQAYIYSPQWRGRRQLDPRIRFPELLTDTTGDISRPACTGLAQKENPQLALYNFLAAGSMVHLWRFYRYHREDILQANWPLDHSTNQARSLTHSISELYE